MHNAHITQTSTLTSYELVLFFFPFFFHHEKTWQNGKRALFVAGYTLTVLSLRRKYKMQ